MQPPLFVILGDQLYHPRHLLEAHQLGARFFMAEDHGLCTDVRHHQQKLVLFLAAMRHHADDLRAEGFDVTYCRLDEQPPALTYEQKLDQQLRAHPTDELVSFEVEDLAAERRLAVFAQERGLRRRVLPSPGFVTPRETLRAHLGGERKPQMARFYSAQRTRLGLLMDPDGRPRGGKWSFDADNRRKLPRGHVPPPVPPATPTAHVRDVIELVRTRFADHPGDATQAWLPVTRPDVEDWLQRFLDERLRLFGDYEDAISATHPFIYHSMLSPALNLGLLTPDDLLARVLEHAETHDIPLNATEGFVRQVAGWREFVRGIYREFDAQQQRSNFWQHTREPGEAWWSADTGLAPLDRAIGTAQRWGWTHHIQRLMVLGNLMTLCELQPRSCHRWFMEMYVDSADWVMGPNVYGMALFSDGGLFTTKPYLCGSSYLRKMGEPAGAWCDTVDGLYWRFIDRHADYFESQPRLSMMPRMLRKLDPARKRRIFALAEQFISSTTHQGAPPRQRRA